MSDTPISLGELIKDDYRTNGFSAVAVVLTIYRLGHALVRRHPSRQGPARYLSAGAIRLLRFIHTLACHSFGCFMPFEATIGSRVRFQHSLYGVFISQDAQIGDDAMIFQHVTIGSSYHRASNQGAPKLGNNVLVGAGAVLIGNITVGDNTRIGANTTVVDDVPAGATVVGQKSRILAPK